MTETPEELARKIRDARDRQLQDEGRTEKDSAESAKAASSARLALRASTDLVAALMVGGFLGYWIDRWLDTKPLFMILFLFIGFGAGFLNIYRSQTGQDYKTGFKNTNDGKKE